MRLFAIDAKVQGIPVVEATINEVTSAVLCRDVGVGDVNVKVWCWQFRWCHVDFGDFGF